MSERSTLDLTANLSRGNKLLVYRFDEKTTRKKLRFDILHAFMEGFNCFRFEFTYQKRKFEDRIALPHAAGFEDKDAIEMADLAYNRWQNTISQIIAG